MNLPMTTPVPAPRTTAAGFVLADQVASFFAFPAAAFLHWRSGRRYRSTLSLVTAVAWMYAAKLLLGYAVGYGARKPAPVLFIPGHKLYALDLMVLAAGVLTIYHVLEARWRARQGGVSDQHTFSPGRSLPFFYWFTRDETSVKRFLEPLLVFSLAYAVDPADPTLGSLLPVTAGALFVRANIAYYRLLGSAWDLGDAAHEHEYRMALVESQGRGGFRGGSRATSTVRFAPPEEAPEVPTLAAIYARLEGFDGLLTPPDLGPAAASVPPDADAGVITITCPCGKTAGVPSTLAGRGVTCRHCGHRSRVPDASEVPEPSSPMETTP